MIRRCLPRRRGLALLFVIASAREAAAQTAPAAVSYEFRYAASGDDAVTISLAWDAPLAESRALVMPRAIPMGYGEQRYDAFVSDVSAMSAAGATTAPARDEGPRWRLAAGTTRVTYRVDLRRMEREVHAASDQSRVRDGYLGALGYSVFAFVDGFEARPVRLRVQGPAGWPVVSTLSPRWPVAAAPIETTADDYYALADGQIVMGPKAEVRRLATAPVPLYLVSYAEGPVDLDRVAGLATTAFTRVVAYFGTVPFTHYTLHQELLTPISPAHEYGMSMEHLGSSTYYLAASAGLTAASTAADDARVLYNYAHHIAHAWVPKRAYGHGYFPFQWELAPVLDSIWFAEGLRPVRGDRGGGGRCPRPGGVSGRDAGATLPGERHERARVPHPVAARGAEPRGVHALRRRLPHGPAGVLARRADGRRHRRAHPGGDRRRQEPA